ncbi:hypothetical protein KC723_03130 [Candidatus Kaiserbacteria bacterium]|nr:hypothetical protein [Candidatus Kaiserbacteria bacterium]
MNKFIIGILALLVLIGGVAVMMFTGDEDSYVKESDESTELEQPIPVEPDGGIGDGGEPLPEIENTGNDVEVIGQSVKGTDIKVYNFGTGPNHILIVGGVHGGYSPNTSDLANQLINHYESGVENIPENITLSIIPELNPDGGEMTGSAGRFNANNVDLNRNFDCEWSATGVWREQKVSGGDKPFSETESVALKDFVQKIEPAAAIVLFSAEGKVYPSACEGKPSQASINLADMYADAAGYQTEAEFDAYAITGDMVNWMAKEGFPAISVLLSDHQSTEFNKNLTAVQEIVANYIE